MGPPDRYRFHAVNLNTAVVHADDLRGRLHTRSSDLSGYDPSFWNSS